MPQEPAAPQVPPDKSHELNDKATKPQPPKEELRSKRRPRSTKKSGSLVWDYFQKRPSGEIITDDAGKTEIEMRVYCKFCPGVSYRVCGSQTTSMLRHIHDPSYSKEHASVAQKSITQFVKVIQLKPGTDEFRQQMSREFSLMCFVDGMPFSSGLNEFLWGSYMYCRRKAWNEAIFQTIVAQYQRGVHAAHTSNCGWTRTRNGIHNQEAGSSTQKMCQLTSELSLVEFISGTFDSWTNKHHDRFVGLTYHYIGDDWQRHEIYAACSLLLGK